MLALRPGGVRLDVTLFRGLPASVWAGSLVIKERASCDIFAYSHAYPKPGILKIVFWQVLHGHVLETPDTNLSAIPATDLSPFPKIARLVG